MFERSTQNKHFKSTRCSTMFTIYTEKQLPRSTIGKITNILFILHVSLSRYVPFECTYFYEGGLRREIRVPRRLRLFVFFVVYIFFRPWIPSLILARGRILAKPCENFANPQHRARPIAISANAHGCITFSARPSRKNSV